MHRPQDEIQRRPGDYLVRRFQILGGLPQLHADQNDQLAGKNRPGLAGFEQGLRRGDVVPVADVGVALAVVGHRQPAHAGFDGVLTHQADRMHGIRRAVAVGVHIQYVFVTHAASSSLYPVAESVLKKALGRVGAALLRWERRLRPAQHGMVSNWSSL